MAERDGSGRAGRPAGGGRAVRRPARRAPRVVRASCAAVLLLVALAGCGGSAGADRAASGRVSAETERQVRAALERWSAAVLARDPAARLAEDARPQARALFDRTAGVPFAVWEYRLTGVRRDGGRLRAEAELRYRLAGHDTVPVTTARTLELTDGGARPRIAADRPADGTAPQLWDLGPVTAVSGRSALVLGTGQPRATLEELARTADAAVPEVSAAWRGPWPGTVVVLAPGTLGQLAAVLGAPEAEYRGLAAVTTGSTGDGPAPADRVAVNPEAYAGLSAAGRRIVLAHEITHVATRDATGPRTPQWLSEGFADWVAYRNGGPPVPAAAAELAREVRAGRLPGDLPADRDFAFGGDPAATARAYQGAWLACRTIAERWGEEKLLRFYRVAGEEGPDRALAEVLRTDRVAFAAAWRAELRRTLS
ncbi:hypothetical protein [Streptomyces sp. NPDC097619]|uniref:hypothetical protein n=1 Tax=Streptomyces sp. NPDC097619 TaxID=3157228 RepID=UPI00331AFA7F